MKRCGALPILAALFLLVGPVIQAQDKLERKASITSTNPDWPKAEPSDVASAQSIVGAFYDVASGPATKARDWDRLKSLFIPEGRVLDIKYWDNNPHTVVAVDDLPRIIALWDVNYRKADVFEVPVQNEIASHGDLVQVFSVFEIRRTAKGPALATYASSFQLLKDVDRYWILEVAQQWCKPLQKCMQSSQ